MNESVDSDALDAQQHVGVVPALCLGAQRIVGAQQFRALDLLAGDVAGVARVDDLHAAQHLANDHLDVLVVDLHALQAVDVLHLVDDVARQFLDAQQAQDVPVVGCAVDDQFARLTTWPRAPGCSSLGDQLRGPCRPGR